MIVNRRDKIIAGLIVFFFFAAWLGLAWLSKSGGFKILADMVQKGF